MSKRLIAPLLLSVIGLTANAQLQEGKKDIEKLCGCFDVEFKYAETFSPDKDYKYHNREVLNGLELALPIEKTDKKIVIQHLLVVGDSMIIKHWREDWVYESPVLFKYEGDKKWTKQTLRPEEVKGKWTQTVWEVDDAPRYQGISEWVKTDGKTFWQSTTNAPLPRREYTTRNDYNILRRGNRLIITDSGWIHEQDNDKISKTNDAEKLIAQEKGINAYYRTKDEDCAAAKAWWDKNGAFWNKVRTGWEEVIKTQNAIALKAKVDNKSLNEYFTDLLKQWKSNAISLDDVSVKAKSLIQQFVSTGNDVAAK